MVDPVKDFDEFREDQEFKSIAREQRSIQKNEPSVVTQVRSEVRDYVCGYCGARGRAEVFYRADLSGDREAVVEIECRAFVNGQKCEHVETRFYGR